MVSAKCSFNESYLSFFILIDTSRVEVEFKSDVNSEVLKIIPYADMIDKYGNDLLDMPVGETDMKVRHILQKFVEVHTLTINLWNRFDVIFVQRRSGPKRRYIFSLGYKQLHGKVWS